jgi:septation ring formation regulator EzrA
MSGGVEMLTKRQLEDVSNNSVSWNLKDAAQTALAYRTMLEQLTEEIRDCFDNGVFYGRLINSLEKKLNEAEALLKESEVEEG